MADSHPIAADDGSRHGADPAETVGAALAALTALAARLRRARKPLHPRGFQLSGLLTRDGGSEHWDVPWLDEPGSGDVVIRLSRGLGLPSFLPDVLGLAVRISEGDHVTDLLFSTTGTGWITRFLLIPRRTAEGSYGTLMPYRIPTGPVMFTATLYKHRDVADVTDVGATITLCVARPRGPWHRLGRIEVQRRGEDAEDAPLSFDPVLHAPPGLPPYQWTRKLREGAYAAARRYRGETNPLHLPDR